MDERVGVDHLERAGEREDEARRRARHLAGGEGEDRTDALPTGEQAVADRLPESRARRREAPGELAVDQPHAGGEVAGEVHLLLVLRRRTEEELPRLRPEEDLDPLLDLGQPLGEHSHGRLNTPVPAQGAEAQVNQGAAPSTRALSRALLKHCREAAPGSNVRYLNRRSAQRISQRLQVVRLRPVDSPGGTRQPAVCARRHAAAR